MTETASAMSDLADLVWILDHVDSLKVYGDVAQGFDAEVTITTGWETKCEPDWCVYSDETLAQLFKAIRVKQYVNQWRRHDGQQSYQTEEHYNDTPQKNQHKQRIKQMTEKVKIMIEVDGGMVSGVYTDASRRIQIDVVVVDRDIEKIEPVPAGKGYAPGMFEHMRCIG